MTLGLNRVVRNLSNKETEVRRHSHHERMKCPVLVSDSRTVRKRGQGPVVHDLTLSVGCAEVYSRPGRWYSWSETSRSYR